MGESKVWLERWTLSPEPQSRAGLLVESTETLSSSPQAHPPGPAGARLGPQPALGPNTPCLEPLMIKTQAPF